MDEKKLEELQNTFACVESARKNFARMEQVLDTNELRIQHSTDPDVYTYLTGHDLQEVKQLLLEQKRRTKDKWEQKFAEM